MQRERVRLKIHGRVQGVLFRMSARRRAEKLGLTGYAENAQDGTVAIVAEGPRERLAALAAWCRTGPPLARVDAVDEVWEDADGRFESFEVL